VPMRQLLMLMVVGALAMPVRAFPFDEVIDVPPDTVPNFAIIGSNTQVNVTDGGLLGQLVELGDPDGSSTNVELNVLGGDLQTTHVNAGCFFNISGGEIRELLLRDGAAGIVTGGRFDQFVNYQGIVDVSITGGNFAWPSAFGVGAEIVGGEFLVNGLPFLENEITATVHEDSGAVLSATLQSGEVLIMSPLTRDELRQVVLRSVAIPSIDTTPIMISEASDPTPPGLRSGQALTLRAAGVLPEYFSAVGATIQMEGGRIRQGLELAETTLDISGGLLEQNANIFHGSAVSLVAGQAQGGLVIYDGAELNVSGGRLAFTDITSGASCAVAGGLLRGGFVVRSAGAARLSGGRILRLDARDGSDVELVGGEFLLNDSPISGPTVSLSGADVLTGTFSDGRPFIFSPLRNWDTVSRVTLTEVPLSPADSATIVLETGDRFDLGLRAGQSLKVIQNGIVDDVVSSVGANILIDGGAIYDQFELSNSTLTMLSGAIGTTMRAYSGTNVAVFGGRVNGVQIVFANAVIDFHGGATDLARFEIHPGAELNLFGSDFAIDGAPIAGLIPGQSVEITERDVILSGVLTDGSPFSFPLNSDSAANDYVDFAASVTVTQVPADLLGDMNCDGVVNTLDVAPFAVALTAPGEYVAQRPHCAITHGDIDQNGLVDGLDIHGFVSLLSSP